LQANLEEEKEKSHELENKVKFIEAELNDKS
jgi:hypothetical protein